MSRRELIVYATQTGELAAACDEYFAEAQRIGATAAQTYPPHCTLTGFFRRSNPRADDVIAEIGGEILRAGPVPQDAVEVVALRATEGWVGLELRSPWLVNLTARIVSSHERTPGDDALRPKDWLHLSLAYDVDDIEPYASLAKKLIDPTACADWEVAVWERLEGRTWMSH